MAPAGLAGRIGDGGVVRSAQDRAAHARQCPSGVAPAAVGAPQ